MNKQKYIVALPLGLYILSLALPVVSEYNGIGSLFLGMLALFVDPLWGIVWIANLFFIGSIIIYLLNKNPLITLVLSAISICLGSISFFIPEIMINEGGGKAAAVLGPGFYVWLLAMVSMLVLSLIKFSAQDKEALQQ